MMGIHRFSVKTIVYILTSTSFDSQYLGVVETPHSPCFWPKLYFKISNLLWNLTQRLGHLNHPQQFAYRTVHSTETAYCI